jgi:hypothetical protein
MSVINPELPEIENVPADVRLDVTAPSPGRALEFTKIVHSSVFVCSIRSIESTPVASKSIPIVVERVVQSMSALASRTNVIKPVDEVAALASRTRSGEMATLLIASGDREME